MSFEAWGTPPSQDPKYCPVCDQESHSADCELGKMQSRAFRAEDEIAELKRQLDEALRVTFDPKVLDQMNVMQRQLAESKAREARLREALTVAINHYADVGSEHWNLFDATLSLPHDDTALKEYRDAVIEEFVGKFKRHVGGDGEFWMHELEDFYQNTKAP